jgi:PAS domain-containing protein
LKLGQAVGKLHRIDALLDPKRDIVCRRGKMDTPILLESSLAKRVLDAIPSLVFIMDRAARIVGANRAAEQGLGATSPIILRKLCGDTLHCLRAREAAGGCGTSESCPDCVVRKAVGTSVGGGIVYREIARMVLDDQGEIRERCFLVTASPFQHEGETLSLLIFEDMTELEELRRVVPVCAGCRKIRDDENFWQHVDAYLSKHTAAQVTHGLCPDCLRAHYPEIAEKILKDMKP